MLAPFERVSVAQGNKDSLMTYQPFGSGVRNTHTHFCWTQNIKTIRGCDPIFMAQLTLSIVNIQLISCRHHCSYSTENVSARAYSYLRVGKVLASFGRSGSETAGILTLVRFFTDHVIYARR